MEYTLRSGFEITHTYHHIYISKESTATIFGQTLKTPCCLHAFNKLLVSYNCFYNQHSFSKSLSLIKYHNILL